jgi:hypothetical protein
MEKDVTLGGGEFVLGFYLHTPTKQKEMEQVPIKKIVIDNFPTPYKDG